jgi:SAM-dependent methyltransferase
MSAREPTAAEIEAGHAVYTPALLAFYDVLVLQLSCRFAWGCPPAEILAVYDRHIGARHLDVGVGTGFFLDRCRWPVADPEVTLLDANAHALRTAARRIRRLRPRTVQASVLGPVDLGDQRFDSIGASFLLHCLPGPVEQKASAIVRTLGPHIAAGGVLFGSTILGRGVRHNALGRRLMPIYNRRGIFSNLDDDADGLRRGLAAELTDPQIELAGTVALFSARAAP